MAYGYNKNTPPPSGFTPAAPGRYVCEIAGASHQVDSKGNGNINVKLVQAVTGKFLCFDRWYLEGPMTGLTHKKSVAFGADEPEGVSEDLVGRRAIIHLVHRAWTKKTPEPDGTFKSGISAEPDRDATDWHGYEPLPADEIPF